MSKSFFGNVKYEWEIKIIDKHGKDEFTFKMNGYKNSKNVEKDIKTNIKEDLSKGYNVPKSEVKIKKINIEFDENEMKTTAESNSDDDFMYFFLHYAKKEGLQSALEKIKDKKLHSKIKKKLFHIKSAK